MDFPATTLTPPGMLLAIGGAAAATVPPGANPVTASPFAELMPAAETAADPARHAIAGDGKPLPVLDEADDVDPDLEAALAIGWQPAAPPLSNLPVPALQEAPTLLRPLSLPSIATDPVMAAAAPVRGGFEPLQLVDTAPAEHVATTPITTMVPAAPPTQAVFVPDSGSAATSAGVPRMDAFVPDATLAPVAVPTAAPFRTAPTREVRNATPPALTLAALTGVPTGAATLTPAPAAQVFAAALHRFAAPLDGVSDTGDDDAFAPPALGGTLLTGAPITAGAIHAPLAAETALDMAGRNWPEAMIARIEGLREAHDAAAATLDIDRADARNATLRLSPDALGSVEVSLRRDADQVHVHIEAEQPRAQALLADAQPRLAELAEARGIRLSHATTTADGGTGQQAPRQPVATAANTLSNRTAAATDVDGGDVRIA